MTSNDHKILAYESKRQYQKIIFLKDLINYLQTNQYVIGYKRCRREEKKNMIIF